MTELKLKELQTEIARKLEKGAPFALDNKTTERINASYLSTYLISNGGQNQIFRLQAGGNREGLNFQHIRSFKIPLPPVSEQQKIAAIFSEADAKIEKEQNQKSQLKALKKGLMQQLLTGKKRVKV